MNDKTKIKQVQAISRGIEYTGFSGATVMEARAWQPERALTPMEVTEAGMWIAVRLLQLLKAKFSMLVS